jgi:hypothetical protein
VQALSSASLPCADAHFQLRAGLGRKWGAGPSESGSVVRRFAQSLPAASTCMIKPIPFCAERTNCQRSSRWAATQRPRLVTVNAQRLRASTEARGAELA